MKLIWYSTAPHVGVGYGTITRELVPRIIKDGHEVVVYTKHHFAGHLKIDGIQVYDGTEVGLVNQIAKTDKYDYIISCMDHWTLPESFHNWVAINMLDTDFIHNKIITTLKGSKHQIAVKQHAMDELSRVGFDPMYAPLGVDTEFYKPDDSKRKTWRKRYGISDDTFVIGLVGINYNNDRKNIIGTIRAFQGFHKRHPNSVLYLHTDVMGSGTKGYPLMWVMDSCGFNHTNAEGNAIRYVNQRNYHLWDISSEELTLVYNGIDVHCLPTHGEGFGLPIVESQACGCPNILTEATGNSELLFGGWMIPTVEDMYQFSNLLTWYVQAPPSSIDDALEEAYKDWESGVINERKISAREGALDFDWDTVYSKYWQPILHKLDQDKFTVRQLPQYNIDFYSKYSGEPFMVKCEELCDYNCGRKRDNASFPVLPGEPNDNTHIFQRTYPIVPDLSSDSVRLMVDTNCSGYKYLSPRFVRESQEIWDKLNEYPSIRKFVQNDISKYTDSLSLVYIDDIKAEFGDDYAKFMQTAYWTNVPLDTIKKKYLKKIDSIVDVGTGNGKRVKELISEGYMDVIGTDINEHWVNNDTIIMADILSLPFDDSTIDTVMCFDVLEHIPQTLKAISELFRVSKKYVIIQITSNEAHTYYEDQTHCVDWPSDRWKRELSEFGDFVDNIDESVWVFKKRS